MSNMQRAKGAARSHNPGVDAQMAAFDPKVKTYIYLYVAFILASTIIGIVVLPFWLLGIGQIVSDRFFHTLKLQITPRHLLFSKGLIFHVEKTIPLENIQDVSFLGGPVLSAFGLTKIEVETAGGGGAGRQGEMSMLGVVDAAAFKTAILDQRQRLLDAKESRSALSPAPTTSTTPDEQIQLLRDIKLELVEIKRALAATAAARPPS